VDSLGALVHAGESETVEFKESWDDDSSLKSLAAFANTRGGTLFIGVDDDRHVVGWIRAGKDLQNLTTKIVTALGVHPTTMREETIDQKAVLIIQIPYAALVSYNGRYYWLVGDTTREIPPDQLGRFLMKTMKMTWDAIATEFGSDELKEDGIHAFISMASQRLPFASRTKLTKSLLQKLGLMVYV